MELIRDRGMVEVVDKTLAQAIITLMDRIEAQDERIAALEHRNARY